MAEMMRKQREISRNMGIVQASGTGHAVAEQVRAALDKARTEHKKEASDTRKAREA